MASPESIAELKQKLEALVARRFGRGNWQAAFRAFDGDGDGQISASELETLLDHAGVGNWLTRSAWVDGVLAELDKDRSHAISWQELTSVLDGTLPPAPGDPHIIQLSPTQITARRGEAPPERAARQPVKAQKVRIADVMLIGPLMVAGGAALAMRPSGRVAGGLLAMLGLATAAYNARNYARVERETEER